MSATPTSALVEEAEKWDRETPAGPWQFAHCGAHRESNKWLPCLGVRDESGKRVENIDRHMPAARRLIPDLASALRRAEAERDEARRDAEAVRAAAGHLTEETQQIAHLRASVAGQQRRAEKAEAERDAQHALVLRLTAERDEARRQLRASEEFLRVVTLERDHAQQVEVPDAFWQRDEARAQVWGLICAGSNMAERRRYFQGLWEALLADGLKRDSQLSELTATRDLLNEENARLQQQLSRPDPVVHETPVDGVVPCCGKKLHDLKDGSRVNEGPLVNCDRMRLLSRVGELSSENLLLNEENARLQKEVATLELLRRGGR